MQVFTWDLLIARDYVEGMWLMLQQPTADDFVLATGETHHVREFVEKSFDAVGIQLRCECYLHFLSYSQISHGFCLVGGKGRV
jgi:GDP-D-mannose dehydratase